MHNFGRKFDISVGEQYERVVNLFVVDGVIFCDYIVVCNLLIAGQLFRFFRLICTNGCLNSLLLNQVLLSILTYNTVKAD